MRVMNANQWTEKAEWLREELRRVRTHDTAAANHQPPADVERDTIADWLRREFSTEPAPDSTTPPLFEQV